MNKAQLNPSMAPILADCLGGRNNNLNLIRMIAASCVLISHAFPIALGRGAEEPLYRLTGMTLGSLAVAVFFALSGLLIARSFDRRPSIIRFFVARVLRLFPALIVVLGLTVMAGALLTTLPISSYFTALPTITYIPRNLSLVFMQYELPGVFQGNPNPAPINGSLWTLFYEVACYAGVVAFGALGVVRDKTRAASFSAVVAVLFLIGLDWSPEGRPFRDIDLLINLAFPFALGMLAYTWRDRLRLDWRIAALAWVACVAASGTAVMPFFVICGLAYSVAWLAFVPKGVALHYNRLGDYSYGIYIYAYPIQQLMAYFFPEAGPLGNMALAAPLVLLAAVASWHFVEKFALDRIEWTTALIEARLPMLGIGERTVSESTPPPA